MDFMDISTGSPSNAMVQDQQGSQEQVMMRYPYLELQCPLFQPDIEEEEDEMAAASEENGEEEQE